MSSDDEWSNSTNASNSNNNSSIVRETLRLYGSLYISCFLVYVFILNKRYPRWFNVRSWADDEHDASSHSEEVPNLAQTKYATSYSWIYQVFTLYNDDQLQQHCSMDAVCFLRALRFGRVLSLMGCFNAIWLIPLYSTASDNPAPDVDPFELITVSNLPSYSNRFIGTVLAAYITYIYAMYLIFLEYQWFTAAKHKFLSTKSPRNYAVYVSGIPRAYRSSQQLANYFSTCSIGSVLEAHIAMETPRLDKWMERRKVVVQKLEHTVALERKTGRTSTHHRLSGRNVSLRKVESVQAFELELEQLNSKIAKAVQDILDSQCRNDDSTVMSTSSPSQPSMGRPRLTRNTGSKDLLRAILADVQSDDNDDSSLEESVNDEESAEQGLLQYDYRKDQAESNGCADEKIPTLEVIGEVSMEESWSKDNDTIVSAEAKVESYCDDNDENDANDPEQASEDPEADALPDGSTRSSSEGSSRYSFRQTMMSGTNVVAGSIGKAGMSLVSSSKSAGSTIVKSSIMAGTTIAKTTKVAGATLIQTASETGVETLRRAQCVGNQVVHSAGAVVPLLRNKTEGKATDAGFVVFSTLYATQTALQMVHHPKPYVMNVIPAGHHGDIFWRNIGLRHQAKRSGTLAAIAATTVLCFFWSVPMAFISSLTEINTLKQSLPKLGAWIEAYPFMQKLLAQLAPLLLLLFNEAILPVVLKWFATWEGHISSSLLEASLFVKLGCFMIIQTFFVQVVSGSIWAALTDILDDPGDVITLLANSLPNQSSYFIQVALAQTFFLQSLELLRVYPLSVAFLRRYLGPRLTEKERRRPWGILHPLSCPPEFWHAETFAQLILLYMVSFVYSPIAPITSVFLCFCFILLESGYRYQLIHNFPKAHDTGGRLWKFFIKFTLASMVVAQLTLIGLLSLKQSHYAGPAMGPLLAMTLLFILFLNDQHAKVSEYLPTRDCILRDSENAFDGASDMDFVRNAYLQPSLRNEPVEPEYEEE